MTPIAAIRCVIEIQLHDAEEVFRRAAAESAPSPT